mmetsp:Transcript_3061/g.4248  ORF Transcript_3061/g.4248 Transcript_3061/m.4248 type:complete len:218 (-) Transcript_3061:2258-2911(-)
MTLYVKIFSHPLLLCRACGPKKVFAELCSFEWLRGVLLGQHHVIQHLTSGPQEPLPVQIRGIHSGHTSIPVLVEDHLVPIRSRSGGGLGEGGSSGAHHHVHSGLGIFLQISDAAICIGHRHGVLHHLLLQHRRLPLHHVIVTVEGEVDFVLEHERLDDGLDEVHEADVAALAAAVVGVEVHGSVAAEDDPRSHAAVHGCQVLLDEVILRSAHREVVL